MKESQPVPPMKKGCSSVDIAALARELQSQIVGARVEKAYQPEKDMVLLRLRRKGVGRMEFLVQIGQFALVTRKPPENPDQPSMIAKILRRDLSNARLVDVSQVGFDRILRLDFERGEGKLSLVFELFGDGNMLYLDAEDEDRILLPMRGEDHGARRLRKGEIYQPPPSGDLDFHTVDEATFTEEGRKAQRDLVRFLALDLGLGPLWAEHVCKQAGVAKNTAIAEVTDEAWSATWAAVAELRSNLENQDTEPVLVYKDGELLDALPLVASKYQKEGYAFEEAQTLNEALDLWFRGAPSEDGEDLDDPRRAKFDAARAKIQRQLDQMTNSLDGFDADAEHARLEADTLYLHFAAVTQILEGLQHAADAKGWNDVAKTILRAKAEGHESVKLVKSLDGSTARLELQLENQEGESMAIALDARLDLAANANALYEASKKAKSRKKGALVAFEEAQSRMQALEKKGLDGFGKAPQKKAGASRHFWFEAYRWTILPGGLLAVGGRSAAQNDAVVKKYLRDGDRYVHAEIHGAPSVVVRPAQEESPAEGASDAALKAAGQFAVCSSRAWKQFGAGSAYWVTPQQVNKTPRSGEFVPRGAWIIHGSRTIMDKLPIAWAVGRIAFTPQGTPVAPDAEDAKFEKWVGGPPEPIQALAADVLLLRPGTLEPNQAAPLLAEKLGIDVETVQGILPPGPVTWDGAP